jgi:unsaturated rhamnogalacturonyl hydrolase
MRLNKRGLRICFLFSVLSAARPSPIQARTETSDSLTAKVRQAALSMQRKDWEQGVLAQAFLESGDEETVIRMVRSALIYSQADGRLAVLGGSGLIDCAMLGEALRAAADRTGDPALTEAENGLLDYLVGTASRAPDGTLYHAGRQMWVDSYNCAVPFLAVAGRTEAALAQALGLRKRLWNPDRRLFHHIWDDGEQRFADPAFWGVGNGWAAVGLARLIRTLPPERRADRESLIDWMKDLLDGCLAFQRPDGLFHNILDDPRTFVETNAAQMLAYAVYTGIQGGWLPESYRPAADRMRSAARSKVDADGFVTGVCGAPAFDKPGVAAEGQAFFLLMEAAEQKRREP